MPPAPGLLELLVDGNEVLGVRTDRTKALTWPKPGVSLRYDLRLDPREEAPIPLDPTHDGSVQRELDRAVEAAAAFRAGSRAHTITIGPDLKKRLGALGYTGDDPAIEKAPR